MSGPPDLSTPREDPEPEKLEPDDPPQRTPEQVGAWLQEMVRTRTAEDLLRDLDLAHLQKRRALRKLDLEHRELPAWINPHDLSKTGWGLIVPAGKASLLRVHLKPLLNLREKQARKLKILTYRPGESGDRFLRRHGETLGTIRPKKVPYYLLIVASPGEIPFSFQYHLSLSHAVGRLWFENPADFKSYAEAVRKAETEEVERPRQTAIFSVENDEVTETLGQTLVNPLRLLLEENFPQWQMVLKRKAQANRDQLQNLLGGGETPGLLLVSCHGRRISREEPEQQKLLQGALVCHSKNPAEKVLFTADDLLENPRDLHGLVSILFSCYGAGTPTLDNFPHTREERGPEAALHTTPYLISKRPFLSRLAVELLRRGALAVVGHIDRGWTTSFVWGRGQQKVSTIYSLEDSLGLMLRGHRLGHALRPLNRRYSQLASRLANLLDLARMGEPDLRQLGFYWTAVNDARNLIVLGDPAVYLRGQREPEVTLRLERAVLGRLERQAFQARVDVETWISKWIRENI